MKDELWSAVDSYLNATFALSDDALEAALRDSEAAGLPAISVPCGFTRGRLPIGLQLTGRPFDESALLRIADAYERDTAWWKQQPPIAR